MQLCYILHIGNVFKASKGKTLIEIDTSELGSFLIETMLNEVEDFLSARRRSGSDCNLGKQVYIYHSSSEF